MVTAELWGGLPAPAPAPVVQPPPRPEPKVEPPPEPRKADIALEPKKIDPPKKVEPPKVEPKKIEPPKVEPPKKVEPVKKVEAPKVDREAEKRRQEELQRIAAAAGSPSPASGSATGAAGGMSDSYRGRVIGCIRPHIFFRVSNDVRPGQYVAEFEVQLLPTGEVAALKLLTPSGLAAYDDAVDRAIRQCKPFPLPKDGARTIRLGFDPVDTR